ncbi:hypothetical protein CEXT_667281 [Caerostris extrusa]|uniref:Uncharacterized protein n=1 Tax=Caerostris extrusa TaxID=172846 RepID=A0AAV4XCC0_CAEEX|nr:hypothetical protein CEXT_667281 [Caerostris extrusa]
MHFRAGQPGRGRGQRRPERQPAGADRLDVRLQEGRSDHVSGGEAVPRLALEAHEGAPSGDKAKEEKSRKQSSFGLPGLKNLILGKPKKKGTLERKNSEDTETLNRIKKISDASNTSQKRISYASTSSKHTRLLCHSLH